MPAARVLRSKLARWSLCLAMACSLLVLLVGPQLESLHALVTPHVYCEVHAQLEHVDSAEIAQQQAAPESRPGPSGPIWSDHVEGEHIACACPPMAPRPLVNPGAFERSNPFLAAAAKLWEPRLLERERHPGLFRLAPKNSPPRS